MIGAIVILFVGLAAIAIQEWKLFAFPRYVERSERLRIRLSKLRHRIVMYAGSGKMSSEEKRAIIFLYNGTTFPLRCPFLYRDISAMVCLSIMDDVPIEPPKVRKSDFTENTRPLLKEFVSVSEDLVNQFADPMLSLVASVSGRKVLDMAKEMRSVRREARKRQAVMRTWQQRACAVAG